jgi:hypothetical protein
VIWLDFDKFSFLFFFFQFFAWPFAFDAESDAQLYRVIAYSGSTGVQTNGWPTLVELTSAALSNNVQFQLWLSTSSTFSTYTPIANGEDFKNSEHIRMSNVREALPLYAGTNRRQTGLPIDCLGVSCFCFPTIFCSIKVFFAVVNAC